MKRSVKVILIVVAVLLVFGGFFGYKIYQIVMGSEEISGNQEEIPSKVVSAPPINIGQSDWPNWRGINFDGKSATKEIFIEWSNGLKEIWHVNYLCQDNSTASWSSPVIQGNRLIVSGRDENNDLIFCINSDTGELIWQQAYASAANSSHGPGPRATPFINENRVYTFGRSGDLCCWQLEDGKLLWKNNVKDLGGSEPTWGFSTTPLVLDDKLIVQGGGKALVIAYDKISGELIWKSMEGEVGYSAAIPMNIEGEVCVLIYHASGLSSLNPADGNVNWTVPWPTEYGVNATTPIVLNDIVFHTSGYKMGCEALKVSKSDYAVLWKSNVMEAQHSDPVLIDGYIYGYSGESSKNNGQFKCIELTTGKEMWSTGEIGQGTTTFVDGHLICLDIKGNLYLIDPNPEGFKKSGEIRQAIKNVKNPV